MTKLETLSCMPFFALVVCCATVACVAVWGGDAVSASSDGESVGESETRRELAFQTYLGLLAPETLDLYTETGQSPLVMCVEAAIQTCGEGQVCGVCVYHESCSFHCRNNDGSCPPSPPCGPLPDTRNPRRDAR